MDFKNAKELLELCQKENLPISEIMLQREMTEGEMPMEEAHSRMAHALEIMKESAHNPIQTPVRSMGGLIGGEAGKLASHQAAGRASSWLLRPPVPPVWSRVYCWHCRNATVFLMKTSSKPCSMPVPSAAWL